MTPGGAVPKISSSLVYAISRRGIQQLGICIGPIFHSFPMKVERGKLIAARGKPWVPGSYCQLARSRCSESRVQAEN